MTYKNTAVLERTNEPNITMSDFEDWDIYEAIQKYYVACVNIDNRTIQEAHERQRMVGWAEESELKIRNATDEMMQELDHLQSLNEAMYGISKYAVSQWQDTIENLRERLDDGEITLKDIECWGDEI